MKTIINIFLFRLVKTEEGYCLQKRTIIWILLTPILIIVFLIPTMKGYFKYIFQYRAHYLNSLQVKLKLKQKIAYRNALFDWNLFKLF